MTAALAVQLILALLGDMPEILAEVERIIADLKGKAPAVPVAPIVASETQGTADALSKPVA